jgi:hypothetical protein
MAPPPNIRHAALHHPTAQLRREKTCIIPTSVLSGTCTTKRKRIQLRSLLLLIILLLLLLLFEPDFDDAAAPKTRTLQTHSGSTYYYHQHAHATISAVDLAAARVAAAAQAPPRGLVRYSDPRRHHPLKMWSYRGKCTLPAYSCSHSHSNHPATATLGSMKPAVQAVVVVVPAGSHRRW